MSPVEAVSSFFARYADFGGRSRRSEYWWVQLALAVVYVVAAVLVSVLGAVSDTLGTAASALLALVALAVVVPSYALLWRRLHDTGRSGWWFLLGLVPFGGIVLLVFCCLEGQPVANRFGPPARALSHR
ncbi:DUF805 domain-containing protein [Kineococcus sp. T13]|uniref:DUF805 domain-containing protein n=1 Tax=Kineococcus vitellinus TaxID=2696565 RepID=UPI0014135D1F|nr:DUF805 domain-containing protein [Kineococcus vitellinus]